MDRHEAELAVVCAALCEHRGGIYAAHSLVYTKNPRGRTMWAVVLLDRNANSTVQAALDQVTVVQWHLPQEAVQRTLAEMREREKRGR